MLRWRMKIRKLAYIYLDVFVLVIAFSLTQSIFFRVYKGKMELNGFERISFVIMFVIFYLLVNLILNVYESTIENYGGLNSSIVLRMLISYFLAAMFITSMLFYMKVPVSRGFLGIFFLLGLFMIIAQKLTFKLFLDKEKKSKNCRNILLVGHSKRGYDYIKEIQKHDYLNINIIGYVSIKENKEYENLKTLGNIDNLARLTTDFVVDEIVVARPLSYDERLSGMLYECQNMGITVAMLLETNNKNAHAQVAMVGDLPTLKFHTVSLNETDIFLKRIIDIFGGLIGLVFFGIAYVIIGPLIKLESSGPIIFKQKRVGKNGRVFEIWKFRSMGINAEAQKLGLMAHNEINGHMFKLKDDPRVTKIGAFVRKTSIDELPQFFNVLRGDMSLVGTRPPTVKEVEEYESRHRKRISIIPGITGLWQVSGRSDIKDFEQVVEFDSEYIKQWSVWLDIQILLKTIIVVLKGQGSK